ncbi:MAG: hypothetical protein IPM92_14125 [Saprospiraceae bacterium]|nr:hypothetical protein [Saprospiraceae bacterium]
MKNILSILSLFALILVLPSCKEQSKTEAPAETTEATAAPPAAAPAADPALTVPPPTTAPPTAEPAQNAKGVWHYTCPKGCPGGAGAQGKCAKCGSDLAHNAGYHQQ